ncbi:MAG: NAD+ synthase [Deltaproteobacteria bacterium]
METVRLGLAQINASVGDLQGNLAKILARIEEAKSLGVDILCFPELAITGYPPEDLLLKPSFIDDNLKALDKITERALGITVIVGFADRREDIYNAAAVIHNGSIADIYHKRYLPNYGVFDENRYFQAGVRAPVYRLGELTFGVNICEDIWYPGDPTRVQATLADARLIINISSSPYHASKAPSRERMLASRASDYSVVIAFCNLTGGQDELVFDGHSAVIAENGQTYSRAAGFTETLLLSDINISRIFRTRLHDPRRRKEKFELELKGLKPEIITLEESYKSKAEAGKVPIIAPSLTPFSQTEEGEIFSALVLGVRDYVGKNGFSKAVIGISGGIDSSLVAAVAVEALGSENVIGVSMPSRFSSEGSVTDARALAANLGIELISIPIEPAFREYIEMLRPTFEGRAEDAAEENLQARVRGNILMAASNKFGWLVLTTGNKSETSVGYCTLYGDMAGGFAVIKDVWKALVYRLSAFYNARRGWDVIPRAVIEKAPSAELRENQRDTDSLPPYDILDSILRAYVEDDLSLGEITAMGFDEALARRIIKMVDLNEYKRRQAPPGVKITARSFGKDRRFPITNLYR